MRKNENSANRSSCPNVVCAKVSFVLLNLIARFGWFLGTTHACMYVFAYILYMYVVLGLSSATQRLRPEEDVYTGKNNRLLTIQQ